MNMKSYVSTYVVLHLIQKTTSFPSSCIESNYSNAETEITNVVQTLGKEISTAQWKKNPNGNVVLSPLSLTIILHLLMLGTNGGTNLELRRALNYSSNFQEEVIHKTFKDMLLSLMQSKSGLKLSLSTKLFTRKGSEILESFKNISINWYSTDIQNLDFLGHPTVSMKRINRWASNSTKGKIKEELSMPLDPNTVCIVYSIISLSAKWENKFDSGLTKIGIFNSGRKNISISMMTSEMEIPYIRDAERRFEVIALPYEGERYSMYILKPMNDAAIGTLIHVERSLNSTYLDSLFNKMKTKRMLVTLPRMRLSQKLDLELDFRSLGIHQIFSEKGANFKRFSAKQRLYVSNIYHKAILEVTEEGTSNTAVSLPTTSSLSLLDRFTVDRPSLIFIKNNENGLILFWVKVIKPQPLTF